MRYGLPRLRIESHFRLDAMRVVDIFLDSEVGATGGQIAASPKGAWCR